ncbi:hypothetical protein AVEN_27870-1 [Araneus ventricosus]|uniref:Chitin-binding type-2 domain-containing protein n=1 Tax=Araneus ventricosus TaxID=182803 RepID=A0A4Y2NM31_ARAVE|nr:hypothetical protein AVEN_27870-1 [Araneus ventricosus]
MRPIKSRVDSLSSSTTSPDYNTNEDYPDNYPDYHDRDYPNPDYYDQTPDREGRSRSFPEDVPDVMSEDNYLKQLRSTIPGIPGVDYPLYQSVPDTSFRCQDQRNPGFYGDVEAQCQVFHICQEDGRHDSFLCPVGTVFSQMNFICDWWFNFKCDETPTFFHLNAQFYTSSGATPASVMIRETMKKMRRFTGGTKYKSSVMKNSMRNANIDFNNEMKRMSMDNQKFMAEMERRRIMNLFLPKMRPANFWKRLRSTTSTDKQMNDNTINVLPTGATAALRNEDFKLLASTKHLDFANSDYPTTSVGTTEFSPQTTSANHIFETTSQFMNNTIQSNNTESILVFESTSNTYPMSNEIETENIEQSGASTSSSFDENGINMSLTLPTASFDIHSISENITLNSIPIEITEEDFNDIMALIDLNIENSTDTLTPLTEEYIANQTDMFSGNVSEANNLLSESPINSTHLPTPSPNTEFNIALYPPSTNISSATLGNGTHVSVSVTIRARTGISRLKWRRVGQGKKRKNLKLENAPASADVDENRDSFMDVEYRKRPIRNKKLRSRIMWIPTKNNSLSRKSHWRIFLNSRPQNFSTYSLRKEKEQIQRAQLTGNVKLPIKIQEPKLEKEQMQKSELTGHVKSPIHIQEAEIVKNKSLEPSMVQHPKAALSYTDSTSETLMTESTKVSFTLMAMAESTTSNSLDITSINLVTQQF